MPKLMIGKKAIRKISGDIFRGYSDFKSPLRKTIFTCVLSPAMLLKIDV
jgi:hypothetical protein